MLHDLEMDFALIEASFAAQYGIRLRREKDISVAEFMVLLSGLLAETPLGVVVRIRGEKDMKVVAGFGEEERKIYDEWKGFVRGKRLRPKGVDGAEDGVQEMFARMFG